MIRHSPFAIRHLPFAIRHLPFAISHCSLILFPLLLLWRPLFAGEAFFWGTPLLQFVPWQRLAAEMWRAGHLPLWNPLVGCGAPLAANYQTAAFYPLNVLYLVLPAEVALSWTTALHLALAGWGMYNWSRAIGLDRFPAWVGALALMGSGFLAARAALFPSMASTFPWLAIWLWRAEGLVQRRQLRDALWLGLSLGLGLLAGHAQLAFYGGLLLAAYLIFRTLQEARRRMQDAGCRMQEARSRRQKAEGKKRFAICDLQFAVCSLQFAVCALILGLGLAAVQLLPTAELMSQSQRAAGVDYDFAMTYSLWPWRLITFAAPDFFGNPGRGDYWGYATYWEDAGYVGVLPLLLALEAVLSRKRAREAGKLGLVRFWAACVGVSLVLALGKNTPVFPFLFRYVPGFDLFQAPARWLVVTTIGLAALAALGAQWWPLGRRGERRGAFGVVVGIALLIGGLAAPLLVPGIRPTFGPAVARLGGTLAVAGLLTFLRRDVPWWRVAVGGFVVLDLLLFGWPLVPAVDRSLYRSNTEAAALRDEPGPVRVYWLTDPTHRNRDYDAEQRVKFTYLTFDSFGPRDVAHWQEVRQALLPNAGMLDGVATANNFDPLLVGRYADLLEAAVETPALLRVMGVTHVASDRPRPEGEPVYTSTSMTLYHLPNAPGRAWIVPAARQVSTSQILAALAAPTFDPTAKVLVEHLPSNLHPPSSILHPSFSILHSPSFILQPPTLHDTPNRVTIRAVLDAPGYLVLADTWYPGWRATVDGRPAELLRANYAFRAVYLGAGEHTVEMVYRPASVLIGEGISLATLILFVVGLAMRHFGREVSNAQESTTTPG